MSISEAISICLKNNTRVYPVIAGNNHKVQVDLNGKIKTFDKLLTQSKLNKALEKTYFFYANKYTTNEKR